MLKRNLIANYLGQGWVALMGLAFIPSYIKYLGMEAYGLIGLFGVLQAWLVLLDMSMTPTLSRELARFTGGEYSAVAIRDLLRSVEHVTIGVAFLIALGIWAASGWMAGEWLRAENLPVNVVANAFAIMGVVTALRFIEGIYRSAVSSLQHQVLYNVINAVMASARSIGALSIMIWITPSIEIFFIWQGLISVATLAVLATVTYRILPRGPRRGSFSVIALRNVGGFAGGMIGITFLALLLTQVDKILLSRILTLSEFGLYTLASTVAGALYMLISPITAALYPRLCELQARGDTDEFTALYHKAAQVVTVIAGSVAIVVMVFSENILTLWVHDASLASRSAHLVSLLILGNLLNGLLWIPYQAQLAYGWTSLTLKTNIVAVLILMPAIMWIVPIWGAEGAAWIWIGLNTGYIFISMNFMYRRILRAEKWRWFFDDLIVPIGVGLVVAITIKWAVPKPVGTFEQLAVLSMSSFATLAAMALVCGYTRLQIKKYIMLFTNSKIL
jgi:O-antigen/teichoic acid export membrane protein